jgi:hypothetical protein
MYYYKNIETPLGQTVKQIFMPIGNAVINFPDVETNTGPEREAYLEWVADGNTATELLPEA